jgi:hypothetical protein
MTEHAELTDPEVAENLATIRERMVAALADDDDALRVLDRVWPADWSDAPEAVVWMLGNAARFASSASDRTGLGPEFMQAWLDRLVYPSGEPREDPVRPVGAQTMLDMICDALVAGMEGDERKVHVTLQRDIERDGGTHAEFVIVEAFKCAHADECGEPFHVRVHASVPRYAWPHHEEHRDHGSTSEEANS